MQTLRNKLFSLSKQMRTQKVIFCEIVGERVKVVLLATMSGEDSDKNLSQVSHKRQSLKGR